MYYVAVVSYWNSAPGCHNQGLPNAPHNINKWRTCFDTNQRPNLGSNQSLFATKPAALFNELCGQAVLTEKKSEHYVLCFENCKTL